MTALGAGRRGGRRWVVRALAAGVACALLLAGAAVPASAALRALPPRIWPGAVEFGIAGSGVMVNRTAAGSIGLGLGTFRAQQGQLVGFEAATAYRHPARSLDLLDVEGAISWQRPLGLSAAYFYTAAAGGLREQWAGPLRQARYPVGFNVGLRVLASDRAAARIEYHYRRILRDPVAEYTEHQLVVGLSLLFHNQPQELPFPHGVRFPRVGR